MLSPSQRKSKQKPKRGLICPGEIAQSHPAGPLLQEMATDGCRVEMRGDWTLEELDDAVQYGPHPTARDPEAAACCQEEALEKVAEGYCKIVPWSELRQRFKSGELPNLKISPIAAIPHKSRSYRMILDLSAKGQGRNGQKRRKSVNELTIKEASPLASMKQLGKTLPRLIWTIAFATDDKGPILFAKLDIKDGFWQGAVEEGKEANFCYVLPPTDDDEEPMIVMPIALQMGWVSSPPDFCAATCTGLDVADRLRETAGLPEHPLEHAMMDPINSTILKQLGSPKDWTQDELNQKLIDLCHLFEAYVDDYIALIQSMDPDILRHHARALLHGISQIFPAPDITGHSGEHPVSQKKLVTEKEDVFDTVKEILGWIFDGVERTMQLPPAKLEKINNCLKKLIQREYCRVKEFQQILGKLHHATLGIPNAVPLLAPLYNCLALANKQGKNTVQLKQ